MQGQTLLTAAFAPFGAAVSCAGRSAIIMTIITTLHPWGASG